MNVWLILSIMFGHALGWFIYFVWMEPCLERGDGGMDDGGMDDGMDDDHDLKAQNEEEESSPSPSPSASAPHSFWHIS